MVGGYVITVIDVAEKNRTYVNCKGEGCEKRETCAIYVEMNEDSKQIRPGDWLWWQAGYAYWTPADKRLKERKIPRVGYSGVSSPLARSRAV
jgi:hypothetical protein